MLRSSSPPAAADDDAGEPYRQACATALRLLARREHSARELLRKLQERGHAPGVLEQVVADLQDDGALSDRRFAETYAETRFERGFGPLRIEAELRERGVDRDMIDAALAGYRPQWAASAADRRRRRFGPEPPRDAGERARQMRFLQQRGFSGEQIRAALADEAGVVD